MITIDELLNMMSVFIEIGEGKDHKVSYEHRIVSLTLNQGVTQRCRLSWLTNSALVYELKCWGGGRELRAGSQPISTAVHRSPNKLWRSNSIFNICF